MTSVMHDGLYCYLCGGYPTDWHHCLNGYADRKKSERYGLKVKLCHACHMKVHSNNDLLVKLKQEAQKAFMKYYKEDFMKVFHRNYLTIDLD